MREDDDDEPLDSTAAADAERRATEAVEGTLAQVMAELAAADPSIETRVAAAGTDYAASGVVFAALERSTASFRLRPEIAAAAARTDGVRTSVRGREWVAFTPRRFDRFALDRASAWFELARRFAGPTG